MPNALYLGGLRVFFYSNEHEPRHIHVTDEESEVSYLLDCAAGTLALRTNYGFPKRRVNRIARDLVPHIPAICTAWEEHFGA